MSRLCRPNRSVVFRGAPGPPVLLRTSGIQCVDPLLGYMIAMRRGSKAVPVDGPFDIRLQAGCIDGRQIRRIIGSCSAHLTILAAGSAGTFEIEPCRQNIAQSKLFIAASQQIRNHPRRQ